MKKILSSIFLTVFILLNIGSTNAWWYKIYESNNLWVQIWYPALFLWKDLALKVIEEWNKITLLKDWEYLVEELFVYDIKWISIEKFLKDKISENCWKYSIPQPEKDAFIVDDNYSIIMDWDINEAMGCNVFIVKYSPILEKVVIVPPMQDCILEEKDGECLLDGINKNIIFLNPSLSSELKLEVEDIFRFLSQKIDSKYTKEKQITFYTKLSETLDKIKLEKRWKKYLLYDYVSDLAFMKYSSLTSTPATRLK